MAKDDEEIIVPKKAKAKPALGSGSKATSKSGPTPQMRRLMRIGTGFGIALGGLVTLVGVMAAIGLVIENFWVRFVVGIVIVLGLPAVLADRMLKHSNANLATKGGIGMVANLFAIVLLGIALMLVGADAVTKSLLRHEGDLYARSGSTVTARLVYFIAGVSPVFPFEKAEAKPGGSASSSASGSASAVRPAGSR